MTDLRRVKTALRLVRKADRFRGLCRVVEVKVRQLGDDLEQVDA
jgi:hypothetical protein